MNKRVKYISFGIIGVIVIVVLFLIIFSFFSTANKEIKEKTTSITNLDVCSKDMQKALKDSMETNLYQTIKGVNDYNKRESLPSYSATLRQGSCTETDIPGVEGTEKIKESTAIVDIPDAKQSWYITYHWVPDGKVIQSDLGTIIIPKCLEKEKLIYGDFNCEKYMSLVRYGTDKFDPILEYVPYQGSGFHIKYEPTTKTVTATIELRESQKDNQKLINNLKSQVVYWFTKRSLDINSYTVVYENEVKVQTHVDYGH